MSAQLFRAFWPIEDIDTTQRELVAEAKRDLPDLLAAAGARLTGEMSWRVGEAWEIGHPKGMGECDLVLIVTAPAEPWADPSRKRAAA